SERGQPEGSKPGPQAGGPHSGCTPDAFVLWVHCLFRRPAPPAVATVRGASAPARPSLCVGKQRGRLHHPGEFITSSKTFAGGGPGIRSSTGGRAREAPAGGNVGQTRGICCLAAGLVPVGRRPGPARRAGSDPDGLPGRWSATGRGTTPLTA